MYIRTIFYAPFLLSDIVPIIWSASSKVSREMRLARPCRHLHLRSPQATLYITSTSTSRVSYLL